MYPGTSLPDLTITPAELLSSVEPTFNGFIVRSQCNFCLGRQMVGARSCRTRLCHLLCCIGPWTRPGMNFASTLPMFLERWMDA